MAVTLHPLARTTPRTRAKRQAESPDLSSPTLARGYGVTAPHGAQLALARVDSGSLAWSDHPALHADASTP